MSPLELVGSVLIILMLVRVAMLARENGGLTWTAYGLARERGENETN